MRQDTEYTPPLPGCQKRHVRTIGAGRKKRTRVLWETPKNVVPNYVWTTPKGRDVLAHASTFTEALNIVEMD